MLLRLQCAARQLCAHHTSCGWHCCVCSSIMLIGPCKRGYNSAHNSYALVTPSLDGDAASAAQTCSLKHSRAATVRHATAMRSSHHAAMAMLCWGALAHEMAAPLRRVTLMRSSHHLPRAMLRWQHNMLTAPFDGGYRGPRDSYTLVTPSLDGDAALAAAACSLDHASAATEGRATAMRSSHHLSMAMLCWGALGHYGGSTAPRDTYALVTLSSDDSAPFTAATCSLHHSMAATEGRTTAMRSSWHLSMVMLRWQPQHAH